MATGDELKEIAAQLRQPSGRQGIEVAEMMNETNIKMTLHAIDRLDILDGDNILELGHGNCGHLNHILEHKHQTVYCGLEISELMNKEAQRINQRYVENKQARFQLYDGLSIPFDDNCFDKVFTVNTIYFWTDPQFLLTELYRVIKPKGKLNVTFAQQDTMEKLPFTQFGFTLYDNQKIKQLVDSTAFKMIDSDSQIETIKSKMGNTIDRTFTTVTLEK